MALKLFKGAEYWRKGRFTDETITRTDLLRRRKLLRKRGERQRLDCIQFTFHSGHKSVMAWAAIGYNYKSKIYFVSYEGEGKGFTQQKYAKDYKVVNKIVIGGAF